MRETDWILELISQEAGQVVWYSHLIQNFPQFIAICNKDNCLGKNSFQQDELSL